MKLGVAKNDNDDGDDDVNDADGNRSKFIQIVKDCLCFLLENRRERRPPGIEVRPILFMVSSSRADFALMARILAEAAAGSAGSWH